MLSSATEMENIFEFTVKPQENCDIVETVSKTVTDNGGIILSLITDNAPLEQIFLRLTTEQIEEQFEEDFEDYEEETSSEIVEDKEEVEEDNNESDI